MRIFLVFLLWLPLAAGAEIYRWVDENGNVVYSDEPRENAETVDLPEISTYKAAPYKKITPQEDGAPGAEGPAYELRIQSPGSEETIHSNQGSLTVRAAISPPLNAQAGHRLAVQVDDGPVVHSDGATAQVSGINRGEHTLHVWVETQDGATISSKASVVFYMWQASQLFPGAPGSGDGNTNPGPGAPAAPAPGTGTSP